MNNLFFQFSLVVALLLGSGPAHADWLIQTYGAVTNASIRSDNKVPVRTLNDNAPALVSAKFYLINRANRTRAWLSLETDTGGDVLFSCDNGLCELPVSFGERASKALKACFSDGPFPGPYKAVKFDATNQLLAGLKANGKMQVVVPVLTGTTGNGLQEKARLTFSFTLPELKLAVKGSDDICESDFAGE